MENGRVTLIYIYALCSGRSELKAEEKKAPLTVLRAGHTALQCDDSMLPLFCHGPPPLGPPMGTDGRLDLLRCRVVESVRACMSGARAGSGAAAGRSASFAPTYELP